MSSQRRATRTERLSVRVPASLKTELQGLVAELQAQGQRTSQSELIEMLVAESLTDTPQDLDERLRRWRTRSTA